MYYCPNTLSSFLLDTSLGLPPFSIPLYIQAPYASTALGEYARYAMAVAVRSHTPRKSGGSV